MLELGHVLVALVAVLLQRAHDHAVNRGRYAQLGPKLRRRHGFLREHLRDHTQVVVGAKGNLAGQTLVQHQPRAPDVSAVVHIIAAARLFGRHVERRAQHRTGASQALQVRPFLARVHGLGHAEIHHLHEIDVAPSHQVDILGLHVAVDDALGVGRRQGAANLAHDSQAALHGQRRIPHHQLGQGLAVEKLHDHEGAPIAGGAVVGDVHDVFVTDGARQPRLLQQAGDQLLVLQELLQQNLDRHPLADDRVACLVHRTHAAFADLANDRISFGQNRPHQGIKSPSSLRCRAPCGRMRRRVGRRGIDLGHERQHCSTPASVLAQTGQSA